MGFRAFGLSQSRAKIAGRYAPEIGWIVPLNMLACLGTCALLYGMGRRLFSSRVALLAAGLYLVGHAVLADTISGHPHSVATFLVTGAFFGAMRAVVRWRERPDLAHWIRPMACAALCCGLAGLTLYALLILAIPIFVLLWCGIDQRRFVPLASFVAIVAIVILPWVIRNQVTSGSPYGLAPYAAIEGTVLFPGEAFDRSLNPAVDRVWGRRAMAMKFWENLIHMASNEFWKLGGGVAMALFVVSFLSRFEREEVNHLRWSVALALFVLIGLASLLPSGGRLLHVLVPMIVLFGVAYFYQLMKEYELDIPIVRTMILTVLIGLSALPVALTILTRRPGIPYPPYYAPLVRHVANMLEPQEWLCTDIPQAAAWYGHRTSVKLPLRLDDFYRIHDRVHRFHGLYLTSVTADRAYVSDLVLGAEKDWYPILNRRVPADFPLAQGVSLPPGTTEQLFLTDRVRW